MKVYVDELPETCLDCENVLCEHQIIEACYATRHPNCPLLSLSDYTKQVRKEVCEQIKAEFDTSGFNKIGASLYPPTEEAMWIGKGFNACKERLFNKLDQIQGE